MSLTLVGQKINQYVITSKIGTSLAVYLGRDDLTMKEMVIKVVDGVMSQKKTIDAELKIGIELSRRCVFLVRYEEVIMKPEQSFVVMEYCSKGNLSKIIGDRVNLNQPFTDDEIFRFVVHVGNGVKALHYENIVHRDLKPENIFQTFEEIFKVGDFGISRSIDPSRNKTTLVMASIGYASPEILDGESQLTKAMDVYSVGCMVLEMIDLCHPFANEKGPVKQTRVLAGKPNEPRRAMSAALKEVRDHAVLMVSMNPAHRPPIDALLALPAIQMFLTAQYARSLLSPAVDPGTQAQTEKLQKDYEDVKKENKEVKKENECLKKENEDLKKEMKRLREKNSASQKGLFPMSFRYDGSGGIALTQTPEGMQFSVAARGARTVFLDTPITSGIYQWVVKVKYSDPESLFYIGACPSNLLKEFGEYYIGNGEKGSCAFYFCKSGERVPSRTCGYGTHIIDSEKPVLDNSTIAVEADMYAGTLCFFVNGDKLPRGFSSMRMPFNFGVSLYRSMFTSLTFRSLPSPTSSPVKCSFLKCPL